MVLNVPLLNKGHGATKEKTETGGHEEPYFF